MRALGPRAGNTHTGAVATQARAFLTSRCTHVRIMYTRSSDTVNYKKRDGLGTS